MTREFRQGPDCEVNFGGVTGVMRIARNDAPYIITIEEADLDVTQARALRDWLNSVLPDEPKADRVCANCAGTGWYSEEDKIPCNECAAGDLRCASSENRTGDV